MRAVLKEADSSRVERICVQLPFQHIRYSFKHMQKSVSEADIALFVWRIDWMFGE